MASRHETRRGSPRRATLVMGVLAGAVLAPSAARAGFFDQLFGGAAQAPVLQASPVQGEPLPEGEGVRAPTRRHAHAMPPGAKPKRKGVTVAERTPKLQKGDVAHV